MNKRKLCQCSLLLILGLCAGLYPPWPFGVAAAALGCWFVLRERGQGVSRRRAGCMLLLLAGLFLFGRSRGHTALQEREVWERDLCPGVEVAVQGTLVKKEIKTSYTLYYLSVDSLSTGQEQIPCSSVILYPISDDLPLGANIRANGFVKEPMTARNEGNYDQQESDYSQHIACRVERLSVCSVTLPRNRWRQCLQELRQRVQAVYGTYLPGEEGGVLAAMTLGDKAGLSPDARKLYQLSGLAHILAVSGMHISVLCMGCYHLLRRLGAGFGGSGLVAGGLALGLGCFWGGSVGTVRAVGMFLMYVIGAWAGEAYDSATALSVMAAALLLERPLLIADSSFIFSFGAALGVISFAEPLRQAAGRCWEKWDSFVGKKVRALAESFLFALFIWMFTLPIVAYEYCEAPLCAVVLNILLLPLLPALLCLGLLGGGLGLCAGLAVSGGEFGLCAAPLLEGLTGVCFRLCHAVLYLYEMAADISLRFPLSRIITGRPKMWQVLLYYLLLYLSGYVFVRFAERRAKDRGRRRGAKKVLAAAVLCGMAFFLLLFRRPKFEIAVLDVGQGDGIFVQSSEGVNFFVDGGSSDVSGVGEYRILPFLKSRGVAGIDYWFVTHTDMDHMSGLAECMEAGYRIGHIVFSEYAQNDAHYETLLRLAEQAGTSVDTMAPGDRCGTGSLTWTCLGPGASTPASDANSASLVLRLDYGDFCGLFTGDIGSEQEAWMAQSGCLAEVDFLKAAHHGSRGSNTEALLDACHPKIAVISCGEDNVYGHPHRETLERLAQAGARVYRTDECGEIALEFRGGDVRLKRFIR